MDFETVTVGKRVGGRRRSSRRLGGTVSEIVPKFVTAPAATNGFVGEDGFRQTDPVFSRRGATDEVATILVVWIWIVVCTMPSSPIRAWLMPGYLTADDLAFRQYLQARVPSFDSAVDLSAFSGLPLLCAGETVMTVAPGTGTAKWYWKQFVSPTRHSMEEFITCVHNARAAGGFTCRSDANLVKKLLWEDGFYKNQALVAMAENLTAAFNAQHAGPNVALGQMLTKGVIAPLRIFPEDE